MKTLLFRFGGGLGAAVAVSAMVSACSQQPVFLPSHDLDRPTDMTFSCLELDPATADSAAVVGAQPMDVCHPPGLKDHLIGGPAEDGKTYKTYAFVANSNRGDVTVVDMSACRAGDDACRQHAFQPGAELVDLDPNSIGFGAAPVGLFPEVIAASQDGCRLVTANRGSCDLTVIDPAALLTPRLTGRALATYSRTFMVRTGAGLPLPVSPGEIAFVPQQTNIAGEARGPGPDQLCSAAGTLAAPVGEPQATPDKRASWRAVVTFPSCDLVALVDLQTETILDSYRVRPGRNAKSDATDVTLFHTGTEPSCPVIDCGDGAGTRSDAGTTEVTQPTGGAGGAPVTDDGAAGAGAAGAAGSAGAGGAGGGVGTGGAVVSLDDAAPALQVGPLAIRPEGTKVYFGAPNWSAVGALDIVGGTFQVPAAGAITALYNTSGVMRLRLSVDPYAYVNGHQLKMAGQADPNDPTKPELGRFVARTDDANLQYLYAIARDASLRILDVSRPDPKECDLGIDPTVVADTDPLRKCFPFGASTNPRRLPQAPYYPGLRFPSAPQDVAFAYYWTPLSAALTDQAVNEQILNGAFAFVLTGGGGLFVINIDPEPRKTARVFYADGIATDMPPTSDLQTEVPLPLPNTQRDPNVVTYQAGLLASFGPPRSDTATPVTTSNGPLLASFAATTTRENATIVPYLSNSVLTTPIGSVQTYFYFPNPVTVLPQTWTIVWEPDITGNRNGGAIDHTRGPKSDPSGLAFALTDYGGSFCTNGIFPGDIMTLNGCTGDGTCAPGRVCVHSSEVPTSASGYAINGLCMKTKLMNDAETLRRCGPLLRSFRRYEIQPTTTVFDDTFKDQSTPQSTMVLLPKKSELPVVGTCGPSCPPSGRPDLGNPAKMTGFKCETDGVNQGRCLIRCDGNDGLGDDDSCKGSRTGSVCVDFRPTDGHFYCADGAPLKDAASLLDEACGLDQLVSYSVSAGRAFVVAGTAVGRTDPGAVGEVPVAGAGAGTGGSGTGGAGAGAGGAGGGAGAPPAVAGTGFYQCTRDGSAPPVVVARIPISLPRCVSPKITSFKEALTESGDTPILVPTDSAARAVFTDPMVPTPNPCLVEYGTSTASSDSGGAGGAGTGDTAGAGGAGGASGALTAGPTYSAVFQNREIRFVLTNLETTVGDTVQIRFGVNGGSAGQQVALAVDSAIGLPARVVLGPVPSADQTLDVVGPVAPFLPSDLPFLYVIDQRTNAGGRLASRGQILRIAPRIADTSPVPGYQSAQTSNSYFPIQ